MCVLDNNLVIKLIVSRQEVSYQLYLAINIDRLVSHVVLYVIDNRLSLRILSNRI